MASSPLPSSSNLTQSTFSHILSLYPTILDHLAKQSRKKKLLELDHIRYHELPAKLKSRRESDPSSAYLEKLEVQQAVDWKLAHGTFRPSISALVASNSPATIQTTTTSAFALYTSSPSNPLPALKKLVELKGIGPATASLLLAIYDPDQVPFFSDELFRYVCWDENARWARTIKYSWREYEELWEGVKGVQARIGDGVTAVEVERVSWVLGKMTGDEELRGLVGASGSSKLTGEGKRTGTEAKRGSGEDSSKRTEKGVVKANKIGKRKTPDLSVTGGTRTSKRIKGEGV